MIGIGASGVAHTSVGQGVAPTPKPPPPALSEATDPPVERSHFEAPPPEAPPKPRFDPRSVRVTLPLRTWILLGGALPLCAVGLVIAFYQPESPVVPPSNPVFPDVSAPATSDAGQVTDAGNPGAPDARLPPVPFTQSSAVTEAGRAADLLVRGQLPEALLRYEHLLQENPRNESYAAMVKILTRRVRQNCESEPSGALCSRYR